jgi:5-hydroxyisourate hydrolase
MRVELYALGETRRLLARITTNEDGRADRPLIEGEDFTAGTYELVFFAGDYFRSPEAGSPTAPFLDQVPIRFVVSAPEQHYHVPLLVSRYSYTTYRGS